MDAEVLVVGGGHNGLICAAYLAKEGIDTLLLEARPSVGGCASTVGALGARFNICHCDHLLIRAMPIFDELELSLHGLEYIEPEASSILAFHDESNPWVLFNDIERTLEGLATSYPSQVDSYKRYLSDALPVARLAIEIAKTPPSLRQVSSVILHEKGSGLTRLLKWSRMSASEVLSRYFDDWRFIMPAVTTGPTVWGVPPETPGTGLAALSYVTRHLVRSGRPAGGSGVLTDAIRSAFEQFGGRIRCDAYVKSLMTSNGAISGVLLDSGDVLSSKQVVAACDPSRVFVDWVTPTSKSTRRLTNRWKEKPISEGYESKIDGILTGLPVPKWSFAIASQHEGLNPLGQTVSVSPEPKDLERAHYLRTKGLVAERPTMLLDFPSVADPTMKSEYGKHVLSLEILFTPYSLKGGWSHSNEPERWLKLWAGLMEPESFELVEAWRSMTPDRYEAEFTMHRGHTPSFGGSPLSVLLGNPRELTRYRTPLAGLYLCGAGTYPGAGIVGVSGRNAADALLKDLRGSGINS